VKCGVVLGCEDGSAAIRARRFLFLRQVTQAKIEQLLLFCYYIESIYII
jgi:hypothetical protein